MWIKRKNKVRRYRIQPEIAAQLGLKLNKGNRYRLTEEKEKEYLELKAPVKRLFFDIETSRMTFQIKDFRVARERRLSYDDVIEDSKIIMISYKWQHEDKVHRLVWDKNQCDKEMLAKFIPIMEQADEIIGHNGDNFDIKVIRTRAIYHRLPMMPKFRSLDTLKKARSGFKFPNNKLDTIAKFLGVGAKIQHSGIKMWDDVENGCEKALEDMGEYCDMDVIVLEDVFLVMQKYVTQNNHAAVLNGGAKHDCPCCGSTDVEYLKLNVTSAGTPKRLMRCKDCGHTYEISNSAFKKFMEL